MSPSSSFIFIRDIYLRCYGKGCIYMILLTILAITLVLTIITAIVILGVGGGAFIVVFADLIVCALVIIWIMKRIIKRKK